MTAHKLERNYWRQNVWPFLVCLEWNCSCGKKWQLLLSKNFKGRDDFRPICD